ncbi:MULTISPECIES: DUF6691 family protein [Pseudomonas]|uniref:YeeE/YedE family protein n=1 Tax=Pseudomonas fluorescens TaxID=294 RepID=A0A4Y9TIN5_PSEFL|nr:MULTISPECIES: DUF6691 family protein [Pseudomonas]MBD8271598.1 YeeE/YedE family protein [Pseudomonas fluorescens]MCF5172977.1 YeeE/YedE family protein [Pseudomonas canadensis]NJJ56123.1 YeeE/YedE family protein [Pseudomonas sp. B14(2022)]TFW44124.1 YeeE/YedE family protein [Pseudomonas fluorescens]
MIKVSSFIAGLLFGVGLLLAGMVNPGKVLAFLDLSGAWDPSLGLVMIGAIAVAIGPFTWARQQSRSLLGRTIQLPTERKLDPRLIGGNLLFGTGWGLAGICPGPAMVILLAGHWQAIVFMLAMLAGMLLFAALEAKPIH